MRRDSRQRKSSFKLKVRKPGPVVEHITQEFVDYTDFGNKGILSASRDRTEKRLVVGLDQKNIYSLLTTIDRFWDNLEVYEQDGTSFATAKTMLAK